MLSFYKGLFIVVFMLVTSVGYSDTTARDTSSNAPALTTHSSALAKLAGFAGEYVVVDARRASDVAAPLDPMAQPPIGKTIRFTHKGIEMEGASCDDWLVTPAEGEILFVQSDPNLIDLTLGPSDSPISSGDQQVHKAYTVSCEGEKVFDLHKVDDRVLVMPTANSTMNLVLEKKLTPLQIKTYQMRLKSFKFYSGKLTGILDDTTLRASRYWYEDRARLDSEQPIPARPAITENLLDTLRVLPQ